VSLGGAVAGYGAYVSLLTAICYAGSRIGGPGPTIDLTVGEGGDLPKVLVFAAIVAAFSLLTVVVAVVHHFERRAKQLVAEGGQAIGTVIELRDTGGSVNDNPRVMLRLRIEPIDGSPAFEGEKTVITPRLSPPHRGRRYPVWYDRSSPARFAVGTELATTATDEVRRLHALAEQGEPGSGTADPLDLLAKLDQLRRDGALTDAEFQALKARILADENPR
jgi:hypothetical protein